MITNTPSYSSDDVERKVALDRLKDIGNRQGIDNLQNIHTPFSLVGDMLDKLSEHTKLDGSILTFNLEFVEWLIYCYDVKPTNITYFTDCLAKGAFLQKTSRYSGVNIIVDSFDKLLSSNYVEPVPYVQPTNIVTKAPQRRILSVNLPPNSLIRPRLAPVKVDPKTASPYSIYKFNKLNKDMKFDVIVGNPPYQTSPVNGKTQPLWHKFVEQSFNLVKKGGYVCFVHPSGWRDVDGRFKKTQELIASKQMEYLELHDIKDGQQTFGVTTRYDWYVVKNIDNKKEKTLIKFQDGTEESVDLNDMPFIPNGMIDEVNKLIAKDGEESVQLLHSYSAYETRKDWVKPLEDDTYKYPCIQNVGTYGELTNVWYSSTTDKGHFGLPKVVFGTFGPGLFIDEDGSYAMCQHCAAIADSKDNLENIATALKNPKFLELMEAFNLGGLSGTVFNRKAISLFRKDFWKDFI